MAIYQGGIKVSGISQIRYYDLGGICNTAANEAAKEIIIDNFVLTDGVTIKALFTNANNELNPTITVKDSSGNIKASGIAIKATRAGSKIDLVLHSGKWRGASDYTYEMWQPYTTLELMYDGYDFVIMGNPLFESYVASDGSKGYSVYANGEINQWIKILNSGGDLYTQYIDLLVTHKALPLCKKQYISANTMQIQVVYAFFYCSPNPSNYGQVITSLNATSENLIFASGY